MSALIQHRTQRLGTDPVGRLLLNLGVPGMLSMFIMALYNVINTFWVAQLGPSAIAATTVVTPYQLLILAIGVGSGAGFGSIISRRFGEGQPEAANRIAGQIFPLTLGFGLLFWIGTTFFPNALLGLMGTPADIRELSRSYLFILGFGVFFTLFSMMANSILRGSGNTLLPMFFLGLGALLNIILDPFLIYGLGPFPAWGVNGAAAASVISQLISAAVNGWYLLSRRSGFQIRRISLKLEPRALADIYHVGLPAFIMQFTASLLMVVFNHALAGFGSAAIVANGLVFRTTGLIMMPIAGISQGLLPLVGYNLGARQPQRLWRAVRLAALGSAAVVGAGYLLLQLFPTVWIRLFTRDSIFLPEAVQALRLATLALPLVAPQFMWVTTFQGLGKGGTAMFISLTRQGLFLLPLLLIMPHFFGLPGVWISVPLADALAFFLTAFWIWRESRRPQLTLVHTVPEPTPVYPPDDYVD